MDPEAWQMMMHEVFRWLEPEAAAVAAEVSREWHHALATADKPKLGLKNLLGGK
jgi:hypothetical protein